MNAQLTESLLHISFPSKATMQQPPINDATSYATTTQQPTPIPASLLDLARNKLCNNHATSSPKDAQQAHQKQGVDVARSELVRLVRFCGEAYGFTEEEHTEALTRALADCDSALTCFRAIKAEILDE
ncbi:hypothetical protein SAMN05216386_0477 [Nitrosospira briensis]|uniref:Uncharacterized protein n=1 Tax=Nitrosospira briensis TaxID=35799 RepID=A0A1I4Y306_9PROT|nr:hypothetical protein [Nitrosospira briensis]SFN32375.1 hypothetical protein SAMN05216386_0477 [Nitrosospira briensis]